MLDVHGYIHTPPNTEHCFFSDVSVHCWINTCVQFCMRFVCLQLIYCLIRGIMSCEMTVPSLTGHFLCTRVFLPVLLKISVWNFEYQNCQYSSCWKWTITQILYTRNILNSVKQRLKFKSESAFQFNLSLNKPCVKVSFGILKLVNIAVAKQLMKKHFSLGNWK